MVEGVTERLREAPRDPGRRLPRAAPGQQARAGARLLAPGRRSRRRTGIEFEVPAAHPHRRARHLQAGRRRGRRAASASSARPSPTRARASATRASTWPGRSVSAHERQDQARQARLRRRRRVRAKVARHRRAPAAVGLPLEPGHPGAAHRRRRTATRWPPSTGSRPSSSALAPHGAGQARRRAARAARQGRRRRELRVRPRRLPTTTAGSRRWPRARARAACSSEVAT